MLDCPEGTAVWSRGEPKIDSQLALKAEMHVCKPFSTWLLSSGHLYRYVHHGAFSLTREFIPDLGTLALGINAPARSVIFLGDSAFLSALMFRQVRFILYYSEHAIL